MRCKAFFAVGALAALMAAGEAAEPVPTDDRPGRGGPESEDISRAEMSVLKFIASRHDRRHTRVPRHVLAFYYTWYGTPEQHGQWVHWRDVKPEIHDIASATHYPARGAYDSHDPEVIDWHIGLAKEHGLTGFICTWWGQGTYEDRAFPRVLERAAKKDFAVTLYWEIAPGEGQAQIKLAVSDLLYMLERYGDRPAFLKVDGKPVIFIYGRVLDQVPFNAWPSIIREVESCYPKDFLLIADGYQGDFARLFDGVHTYNIAHWVTGKGADELREASARSLGRAVGLARGLGKVSCVTVIPGYDDTKLRSPGLRAERQDGQTYRTLWEEALKADPDWLLITSWNEWHEGSEIEPSFEDDDRYLKMTAEYARRFMATPRSAAEGSGDRMTLDPAKAREMRVLYRDKTIGILPDFGGDAPFWLADVGVALKELTWAEVLDPASFNPVALPLVLYASGEHFVRSLNEEGDVETSLRRYLDGGGFLMAIPTRPFPFYYDEKGEVVSAAGRLGFPIAGSGPRARGGEPVTGWERPPTGVPLSFHVDTDALPDLVATASFPNEGDVRWRPATPALTSIGDVYVPLATLRDGNGEYHGDGIAYVEHEGKCLYVWTRMPEVLGTNETFFALFRFAAQKLGFGTPH